MTSKAEDAIGALRTGYDTLAEFVGGLRPDDLVRPSGASEWKVADVLSHLGSGAEIGLATLEGALDGTGPRAGDFNTSVWDRWNAMSPADQAANFLTATEKQIQRYEGLDDDQLANLRIDFGFLPEPVDVATAVGMRLTEFALHSWDVRVGFDADAALAPESTEILLDSVGRLLSWAGKADQYDGSLVLTVNTTAPDRTFGLSIADTAELTDTPASADGVLNAPAEYIVRLITGRNAPEHTPASVTLTSEKITLAQLRPVFPGF
ncbi:maleylpyruvate isomerase family mycothiol-dependent enzyme [Kribbella sp. DT2]|uniref:maleylpyruvate isomerase family mycothiol-dependent enzyme n=1 Tax=Kribbella sp. DT2 TaxID=3393427 RepID=UPI003CEF8639